MKDLIKLRNEIDAIDKEILHLFQKRMGLVKGIAEYKAQNNLPVLQGGREEEILSRVIKLSPSDMAGGTRLLFTNLMDISKCYQQEQMTEEKPIPVTPFVKHPKVALQGIPGSYSHAACEKLFGSNIKETLFFERFEDVFDTIRDKTVDYAVIPIENSTAGEVRQTYELMAKYRFFIVKSIRIRVRHVLAGISKDIPLSQLKTVYSHDQALMQSSDFLLQHPNITPIPYKNTAISAQKVSLDNDPTQAAICSPECAKLYGLEILSDSVANTQDNYTRFIVIAPELQVEEQADIVTLALSLPHTPGALYRLLTRFSFAGLNLLKIENRPLPVYLRSGKESALFYLDFAGNIKNPSVLKLLQNLENEFHHYRFLGNYTVLDEEVDA